jgi:hypothetical protein
MKLSLINLKLNSVLIFSVLLSISVGCNKDKPEPEPKELELPPATTSGNNTFGCKINGEVYLPKGVWSAKGITSPVYFSDEGGFGFDVRNFSDFEYPTFVSIYVPTGIFGVGIYEDFAFSNNQVVEFEIDTIIDGNPAKFDQSYITDTTMYRKIEITRLDLSKGIVSGLFEFTAVYPKTEKRISVTEGRFDLKGLSIQ